MQAAISQVSTILRQAHRLQPGDVDDFAVRNLSQIADTAKGSSQIMALLLAVVASISLLVGGIGIMNILLVSVTERTREIGLRMGHRRAAAARAAAVPGRVGAAQRHRRRARRAGGPAGVRHHRGDHPLADPGLHPGGGSADSCSRRPWGSSSATTRRGRPRN
ncbi:MAG: hypothetical protein WDM92_11295 [Caulobacteraceae bacterium]